ncbi:MAG: ABC transporter permease [Chloroflexi bacterium]|nr:ABC transporter permease [Chloroflexota bacterium]
MSTNMKSSSRDIDDLIKSEQVTIVQRITRVQALQIVLVLFAIVAIFSIMAPDAFFTVFNLRSMMMNTAIFAVLGVGATFVVITAGIDLSIGSVLVFSSVISAMIMGNLGASGWATSLIGLAAALAAGAAWGWLNGFLVAKAKVPAFIVTLGTLGAALGLAQVITGGIDLYEIPTEMVDTVGFGNLFGELPNVVVLAAVVCLLGGILLQATRFGLTTFAIGSNPEACRRVGVKVDRHLIWVYVLSGVTAGLAGWLSIAFFQQTTIGGNSMTALTVIAGVVIGGTSLFGGVGTIFGTVIGLLLPVVLQSGFIIIGVQSYWQGVVIGIFLIGAVYIDAVRRARATRGSGRKPRRLQVGGVQVGPT